MESDSGLGYLAKIPIEIRQQIYSFIIPRSSSQGVAMARTCRCIHDEVIDVIYPDAEFIFTCVGDAVSVTYFRKRNRIHIPIVIELLDKFGFEPSGELSEKREAAIFRRIPYERFKCVAVEIEAPDPEKPGDLIFQWECIRIVVDILMMKHLSPIQIRLGGNWCVSGRLNVSAPPLSSKDSGGDIGLLLGPFGRLLMESTHATTPIFLTAPAAFLNCYDKCILKKTPPTTQNTTWTRKIDPGDSWERSYFLILRDRADQDRKDAQIDYLLDELDGRAASWRRARRWVRWDEEYEKNMVQCILLHGLNSQRKFFERLAERWTVLQGNRCEGFLMKDEPYPAWAMAQMVDGTGDLDRRDPNWEIYKRLTRHEEHSVEVTRTGVRWGSTLPAEEGLLAPPGDSEVLFRLNPLR